MARKKTLRPGRTLIFFLVGVITTYVLVGISGNWKPELGLDLQGGTRITLIAEGNPKAENLDLARSIIDQRVNSSGVAEAEVSTQSNRFIVVEIPGERRRDLLETVKRQAQMRFRLVACSSQSGSACGAPAAGDTPQGPVPGAGVTAPGGQPSGQPNPAPSASPKNRAPLFTADRKNKKKAAPTASASPSAAASPSASPSDASAPSGTPAPAGGPLVDQPLKWMNQPDPASVKAFNEFSCPTNGAAPIVEDDPDKPLVTCGAGDEAGVKYLLSAAMIEGSDLKSASAQIPQQQVAWVVSLSFNGTGTEEFTKISKALYQTNNQFAVVLDGQVLSAPTMNGLITNGQAQIEGNFTEQTAQSLATSLKFGALPISFKNDPSIETIGPSLAGDQLSAGITAGALGLGLVMLYCLLYYRGLGLVVLGSLVIAAALTYSMVLLLGIAAGLTLTLPGIAGLIIAVGITADSFIIFFERIRDEMREGRSMRVAVETGWKRAKVTRLAANVVSLLSATILYFFATGAVKGFGFALGLSTLIDLAVLFWFTKPMVSYLARYTFFNGGGRLSGLSRETLGMDAAPAGGKA